ncbi:MAG: hypothetical protein JNJ85_02810 [Candidatus Kapabacteria bacterium]|nr:hypothetical protein [Candidatus Kapabacteria bacterium]
MVKLIVYSFAVLGTALLFSCGDTTQATVTQSQPAADYLPSGKAGTVYTYNTTYIYKGSSYDTIKKRLYLTLLSTSEVLPSGIQAIKIERKTPFAYSDSYAIDTLYYYAKDNVLYQYSHDYSNPTYYTGKVLIGSVQKGDSVSISDVLGNTHTVVAVDEQVTVPYGTINAMHLRYDKASTSGTLTETRTTDLFYTQSALQAKAHSLHTIADNGKYTTYEDYTMELESVK